MFTDPTTALYILLGLLVFLLVVLVGQSLLHNRKDRKVQAKFEYEENQARKRQDQAKNANGRISNLLYRAIKNTTLQINEVDEGDRFYLYVFRPGVEGHLFREESILAIFIEKRDLEDDLPIWVNFTLTAAGGHFLLNEKHLKRLGETLTRYIKEVTKTETEKPSRRGVVIGD